MGYGYGYGGLSCGGTCMKYILFVFNILLFLSGAVLLALGLWMLLDPNFNDYLDVIEIDEGNPHIMAAMYTLIGVGGFIFIVGFLGCCGACRESPCMLCTYVILLVIVLLVEIGVGVLIIVYDEELANELEAHMLKTVQDDNITNYVVKGEEMDPLALSWHTMQINLKCCGAASYLDYRDNANFQHKLGEFWKPVPQTCCVLTNSDPEDPVAKDGEQCMKEARKDEAEANPEFLHTKGCYGELTVWFDQNKIIVVCVAFGVALLQILGIVCACCVRKEALRPVDYGPVRT